ncbi:MAG: 16S rRNA (cytosine(1402)-N(4))-methyltransferase RsmH [Patescibacteria group bacterium]
MIKHISVLLQESVDGLNLEAGDVAIDGTVGQGGHALLIADKIGKQGTIVAVDADEDSIVVAKDALKDVPAHVIFVQGNFRNLKEHAERIGISSADAIIFDLGWHQGQLESGRGFSFKEDAPLLMTRNEPEAYQVTARDIIAGWDEDELATLFKQYGGERFSGRIARVIVETRTHTPITKAAQLAEVVAQAVPAKFRRGRIHPATKVFQALRIAVNDELEALKEGLQEGMRLLAPEGRLAVISFHSLEDKIVKDMFRAAEDAGEGRRITKKPIVPTRAEAVANPRARSAKLRIFEKN